MSSDTPAGRTSDVANPVATATPRLWAVASPLFFELCLGIGMGMVGTMLAARISNDAGAAFAVSNQIAATLFILFRIIGAGVSVVVTQSLGSGHPHAAHEIARAAVGASSWLGVATATVTLFCARPLLNLMNTPEELLPLAVPFLQLLAPALLLDAWNATMSSVLRAHLRGRDTLVAIVVMHCTHLAIAVPLMLGLGPFPALGLGGFALALLVSRSMGLGLHLWMWRLRLGLKLRLNHLWRLPRVPLLAILRIGLPGAAENAAYRVAFMVSVAVAGHLGAKALATQAYTLQIMHGVLLFGLATGLAIEIVIGHLIGAGELHAAHRMVRRALARGLLVSVLVATLAALAGTQLLQLFTNDADIIAAGVGLLWWTVLLEPGRTFNLVVINALRAAGDARFPVMAGAASMLIVLAGGSWWLGVHLELGLTGVWIAYAADEWIRGLIMWRRWAGHGWVVHARAARRRVRGLGETGND